MNPHPCHAYSAVLLFLLIIILFADKSLRWLPYPLAPPFPLPTLRQQETALDASNI